MTGLLAWPALIVLGAGAGTVLLIRYLLDYRGKPGANWFIVALVGQAIFCFAYGIGLLVFNPAVRYWLEIVALVGAFWISVPFLGFALGYTGRGKLLRSWVFRGLLVFPAASTLLLVLNSWRELFFVNFEVTPRFGVATVSYSFEPIALVGLLGAGIVAGVAVVLLFDTVFSYGPLYRSEAVAVALSPVPPIVGIFPWLFGFGPAPELNTFALGMLPHVLLDTYAFARSGMFDFYPATNRAAERSTIDHLNSPVLVLEEKGRIVDLNDAAEDVLGLRRAAVVTRPVSEVFEERFGVGETVDLMDGPRLSIQQDRERIEFRVESSPLIDSSGDHVGHTLLFQDVTDAIRREERLSVLNRVLRHNLRNDLSVVMGYVNTSQRRTEDAEIEELLGSAQAKVDDLVDAGNTAREIENTIASGTLSPTSIDFDSFLATLVGEFGESHPHASISTQCTVRSVETDADILDSVLSELIENAIVHNDAAEPVVRVEVTRQDGEIVCTVSDDGPGIPDYEVSAVQTAEESALEHGSGLGLWLVKWGVTRLGGTIAFDNTARGTTVTVNIPATASAT